MTTSPAPTHGLKQGGKALYEAISGFFELAAHEEVLLRQAALTIDVLDALQLVIERDGPVVSWGADGNVRLNPAVAESRQQRSALQHLIKALKIPAAADDERPATRRPRSRHISMLPPA